MTNKPKKSTPQTLDEAFEAVCQEMEIMFIKKHNDYGKGNILANKELGIAMRVSEKVERLKHLLLTCQDPANESVEETWVDIGVYAIIAVMYKRGWFEKLEMSEVTKLSSRAQKSTWLSCHFYLPHSHLVESIHKRDQRRGSFCHFLN